jgi:lysophospholipase L1-like esterase
MHVVRAVASRVMLAGFGVVVAFLLLEGLLQLGGLYTWATRARGAQKWLRGGQRVVCLGDSNTYGFFLERPAAEAFPTQLQELWNARDGAHPIEVLNLGVPGMNSSKLRTVLPDLLGTLRPDIVMVMVGVNDFWIAPAPVSEDDGSRVRLTDALWRLSRLFRLVYMIRRALEQPQLDLSFPKLGSEAPPAVTLRYGDRQLDLTPPEIGAGHKTWRDDLRRNLAAMAAQAANGGARLILLTYPAEGPLYAQANAAIRAAAAQSEAALVDLGSEFLKLCPTKTCDDLFFFDLHPTLKGHQLAARVLAARLEAELRSP